MNLKSLMSTSLRQRQDRRAVLRAMAGALSTAVVPVVTVAKPADKIDVCHYDAETDSFKLISVNGNALGAHLAHQDYEPVWDGTCSNCVSFEAFVDATMNGAYISSLYGLVITGAPVRIGHFLSGDSLDITATGSASRGGGAINTGPDGEKLGEVIWGALFGSMNGTTFYVGSKAHLDIQTEGDLDLYYFDTDLSNNTGGYAVTVAACR